MRKQKTLLKSIFLILIIAMSYVQVIQLAHNPHARKISTETPQINTSEFSCYVCYVIQHSQSQHFCSFNNTSLLAYQPDSDDLYINTISEEHSIFTEKGKNKSPPLS